MSRLPNRVPRNPPIRKPSIVERMIGPPFVSRNLSASQSNSSTNRNSHWKSIIPKPVPIPPPIHIIVQSNNAHFADVSETAFRNPFMISPSFICSVGMSCSEAVPSLHGNRLSSSVSLTNVGINNSNRRTGS